MTGFHVPQPEVEGRLDQPQGLRRAAVGRRLPRPQPAVAPGVGVGLAPGRLGGDRAGGCRRPRRYAELRVLAGGAVRRPGQRRGQGPADRLVPAAVGEGRRPTSASTCPSPHCCATPRRRSAAPSSGTATGSRPRAGPCRGSTSCSRPSTRPATRAASSSATTTCSPTGRARWRGSARRWTSRCCRTSRTSVRREVDEFVDPTLHRQKVTFADVGVPQQVEALTEDVWKQFIGLAVRGGDSAREPGRARRVAGRLPRLLRRGRGDRAVDDHALRPRGGGAAGEQGVVATRSRAGVDVVARLRRRRGDPAGRAGRPAQAAPPGARRCGGRASCARRTRSRAVARR